MELKVNPDTYLFRRVKNGRKGEWHILEKSSPNGFNGRHDKDGTPEHPEWWDTFTFVSICDVHMDSRASVMAHEGNIEFTMVKDPKVKRICSSCYPYGKIRSEIQGLPKADTQEQLL